MKKYNNHDLRFYKITAKNEKMELLSNYIITSLMLIPIGILGCYLIIALINNSFSSEMFVPLFIISVLMASTYLVYKKSIYLKTNFKKYNNNYEDAFRQNEYSSYISKQRKDKLKKN